VLLASALWGASGSLTKILRVHGFAITDILSWRYLCGLLTLLAVARVLGHPSLSRLSRVRFRPALVMALSIFGTNAAFTWSNFFTTVANAIALSFTAPLFAAVLGWLVLKERVRPSHQAAIGIGVAGVSLLALSGSATIGGGSAPLSPNIPVGNGLALLSGLLFGGYFVLARRHAQRQGEMLTGTIWQFLILSGLLWPLMIPTLFKGVALSGWLYLTLYSTACTAAPILLLNLSTLYLNAHEASLLSLSEIPFSIVFGMAVVGEFPPGSTWAGVGLILTAGLIAGLKRN
jgi:drug/metabolite transporter (DMT)-like permease